MARGRRPPSAVWLLGLVTLIAVSALLLPDFVRRHQLYSATEDNLPAWRKAVGAYLQCMNVLDSGAGSTAERLLRTRLTEGSLPARLQECGGRHLSSESLLHVAPRQGTFDDPLISALHRFQRALQARRRDHGPDLPGVDDRAIRGTCERVLTLVETLREVEHLLDSEAAFESSQCTLELPTLDGLAAPSEAESQQLLDLQLRGRTVLAQFKPVEGGTRFGIGRLDGEGESGASVKWTLTDPMPVLADGRDYAWDAAHGLWTVGFDAAAKKWRGYQWQSRWNPLAVLPSGWVPDRVDWVSTTGARLLVARSQHGLSLVSSLDKERTHGAIPLPMSERFDPMTHVGPTGSVTTVDLEFPAAGPHLSVSHLPAGGGEASRTFMPLGEARTQWFLQPHVVGCSHQMRHWAVVGSRWLTPTADAGDGRWWVLTSADDGASWQHVAKTSKDWQLFGPVLACHNDSLLNVTISRVKGTARTVFVQCTPDGCQPPRTLAEPAARHIGLDWSESGLSILLAFRAHAALLRLEGTPVATRTERMFRRLPVRSAWDTMVHIGNRWFDLVTVDPLPW